METEPVPSAISSRHRSQIQSNRSFTEPGRRRSISTIAGRGRVVRRRAGALLELALCGERLAGALVGRGRVVRERRNGRERVIAVAQTRVAQVADSPCRCTHEITSLNSYERTLSTAGLPDHSL